MSTMDIAVAIALGLALVLAAISIKGILVIFQGKATPTEQKAIAAIMPYVYKAIAAGERFAYVGLDQFNTELEGIDKKKVADSVYNAIPDSLMVGMFPVPTGIIKTLIPPERFEQLVKQEYEATKMFILQHETYLKSQIDALLPPDTSEPPDTAPASQPAPITDLPPSVMGQIAKITVDSQQPALPTTIGQASSAPAITLAPTDQAAA